MVKHLRVPALVLLVVLVACGSDGSPTRSSGSSASQGDALVGTSWDLVSYQTPRLPAVPAAPNANAVLAFAAGGVLDGSTGCNHFGGSYTSSGRTVSIELGPMTQIACSGELIAAQESAIVTLLPTVRSFSINGDTLTLLDGDDATVLIYRAGLSGLEGTSWEATGVNNGNGGVTTTALTEKLTATFAAGGVFEGFGGCNNLGGQYATSGVDGLTITGLTSTRIACDPEVTALEQQYLTALTNVATYEIKGTSLTLRDDTGATQATFTQTS